MKAAGGGGSWIREITSPSFETSSHAPFSRCWLSGSAALTGSAALCALAKASSWRRNPALGATQLRSAFSSASAVAELQRRVAHTYAATSVAERHTPAPQCTSTRPPPASAAVMNSTAAPRCDAMSSVSASASSWRKCFTSGGGARSVPGICRWPPWRVSSSGVRLCHFTHVVYGEQVRYAKLAQHGMVFSVRPVTQEQLARDYLARVARNSVPAAAHERVLR